MTLLDPNETLPQIVSLELLRSPLLDDSYTCLTLRVYTPVVVVGGTLSTL